MSVVLVFITLMMAVGRDSIVRRMRQSAQYINTVSGVILIAAGIFIIWYWATILASGGVAAGQNGLIRFVDRISATLTDAIGTNARPVGAALILLVGGTALYLAWRRVFAGTTDAPNAPNSSGHEDRAAEDAEPEQSHATRSGDRADPEQIISG